MKSFAFVLLGALFVPAAVPGGAAPEIDESISSPLPDRWSEFTAKFQQALELGAAEQMASLVKKFPEEAVWRVMVVCESIAEAPSEALEKEVDALERAWKEAYKTDFVKRVYEYVSLLRPDAKRHRLELVARYRALTNQLIEKEAKKELGAIPELGQQFQQLALALDELGDGYYASQCFIEAARCFDENLRGKEQADYYQACSNYGQALAARKRVALEDARYAQTLERYESLAALGYGKEPPKAGSPEAAAAAAAAAASVLKIPMRFELVADLEAYVRPLYSGDQAYPSWAALYLKGKGSNARFPAMDKSLPVSVVRTGSAEAQLDVNGDGLGDAHLPLAGKIDSVSVKIGQGEDEREWGFVLTTGLEKDTYQGAEMNLGPDDNQMTVYINPAASMVGTLNAIAVRVFDDTMDGVYGGPPSLWNHLGLTKDRFQVDLDSIALGTSKRARPWSELLQVGEQWYRMGSAHGGKELEAKQEPVLTGTLKLEAKGVQPEWLVVRGRDKLENCFYELVEGGAKGVDVPVGRYEVVSGLLKKGKRRDVQKVLIVGGQGSASFEVKEGVTTAVPLGAPLRFDFQVERKNAEAKVPGDTVSVVGVSGEHYERRWGVVIRPEVSWRKSGSKKGSKPENMPIFLGKDDIDALGWQAAWHPLDLLLKLDAEGGFEFQLAEQKNKFFGEIKSEWKE